MTTVMTARETADALHVSVRTLDRYVASGLITPTRTPGGQRRFKTSDVAELLEPGTGTVPQSTGARGAA